MKANMWFCKSQIQPCISLKFGNLYRFVTALHKVSEELDVPLAAQYDALQEVPGWKEMLSDSVYPGELMYELKASRTFEKLVPVVEAVLADE